MRKKVLFIARWYPDRNDPMLGLFVQQHAIAAQELDDISVLYVTADSSLTDKKVLREESITEGVHELKIYFKKSPFAVVNGLRYINHYFKGIRRLGEIDWIHVHILTRAAIPAIIFKKIKGIPYIITEHWSRYLPQNVAKGAFNGWLRKLVTKSATRGANVVMPVTGNLGEAMIHLGLSGKYKVVPNVVDTQRFVPAAQKVSADVKSLINVSCFDEPAKNLIGLIDGLMPLFKERDDFILELIGDGKDFNLVYQYAQRTGMLGTRIYFTGLLQGAALVNKMQHATAMVMFSNYENLSCTILESYACGVPVISTDVGGIKEYMNAALGILIPAADQEALRMAVKAVLNKNAVFDSTSIRKYAVDHFSKNVIGNLLHQEYHSNR